MCTNNQVGRRLDFSKISNRNTKIVSSEEALRNVKPIEWSEDVLNGKRGICKKSNPIYNFENFMANGTLVEKVSSEVMYDIRKMSEYIREIGRTLTEIDVEKFIVSP